MANFRFDSNSNTTWAYLSTDTNGDGLGDSSEIQENSDQVNSIWRAGKQLWARNPASAPRTIYTPLLRGGTQIGNSGLMTFSYGPIGSTSFADNSGALQPYLQMPDHDSTIKLMKYVHGFDFPGDAPMRNRTVQIGTDTGVWKLGDIISSTPRIQSTVRLNSYGLPPPAGYADPSYNSFTGSKEHQSRSTAYVGANDGMLHAFKLGVLPFRPSWLMSVRISVGACWGGPSTWRSA